MRTSRKDTGFSAETIADLWKQQMKKGYLKLMILFTLLREPLHGYEIIKRINEYSFGLLTPTFGALYPSLRELENKKLIKGIWKSDGRRIKVYEITENGKKVFEKTVRKHLEMASTIRKWIFRELVASGIMDEIKLPSAVTLEAVKVLLLDDKADSKTKMAALKRLKEEFQRLNDALNILIANLKERIRELELKESKI